MNGIRPCPRIPILTLHLPFPRAGAILEHSGGTQAFEAIEDDTKQKTYWSDLFLITFPRCFRTSWDSAMACLSGQLFLEIARKLRLGILLCWGKTRKPTVEIWPCHGNYSRRPRVGILLCRDKPSWNIFESETNRSNKIKVFHVMFSEDTDHHCKWRTSLDGSRSFPAARLFI